MERQDDLAAAGELSAALKAFHRALIRAEMGDDPDLQGPYTQLFALIGDPRFAWMAGLSDLIARINHAVAEGEIEGRASVAGFRDEAAAFIGEGEDEALAQFRLRHLMALQTEPEVGLATGSLRRTLAKLR